MNSIALLLLIWIYFYTIEHEEDEKALAAALAQSLVGSMSDASTADDIPVVGDTPDIVEDSEF